MSDIKPKKNRLESLPKHTENPFIEKAVGEIKWKFRNQTIKSKDGDNVNMIVAQDGEVLGNSAFIRAIEVDEDKFAKLYLSNLAAFWDLQKQSLRVFSYILSVLRPNDDRVYIDLTECMKYTGYASKQSVFIGLADLVSCGIIARSSTFYMYYINPLVIFNGNRVTFAKTFIKKKKETNPNQTSLLDQPGVTDDN